MSRGRKKLGWCGHWLKNAKECWQPPEATRGKEHQQEAALPWQHLDSYSGLQNYDRMKFSYLKSPSLWSLVTTASGNKYPFVWCKVDQTYKCKDTSYLFCKPNALRNLLWETTAEVNPWMTDPQAASLRKFTSLDLSLEYWSLQDGLQPGPCHVPSFGSLIREGILSFLAASYL